MQGIQPYIKHYTTYTQANMAIITVILQEINKISKKYTLLASRISKYYTRSRSEALKINKNK